MNKYYAVLGLPATASKDEIRRKYRQLVLIWHPDRNSSPEAHAKFIQITEAYDVLMGERPAPRTAKTTYTYTAPKQKSPYQQRQDSRVVHDEMLRRKFENIRQQHLRAPDAQRRKQAYYRKSMRYFIMAGSIVVLAFVLAFTVLGASSLICTIPISIGAGLTWLWTGGRIKMRADMIYSGRTDYTNEDIAEFFRTRSGEMSSGSPMDGE